MLANVPTPLGSIYRGEIQEVVEYTYNSEGLRTGKTVTTGTVKSVLRNGLSMDEDGEVRFYEDGEPIYAGLIYVDGYYYYINSSLKAVRDTTYWVSTTNGLMEEGRYTFDAQAE